MNALKQWRFLILLSALVLGLVCEPVVLGLRNQLWLFDFFYTVIVLSVMGALAVRRRTRLFVMWFGALTLLTTWIAHALGGPLLTGTRVISETCNVVFLSFSVFAVVRAVIRRRAITLDSVFGAISGYLLLGLAWSNAYMILHGVSPGAFHYGPTLAPYAADAGARMPLFTYYSFVTLSTLGYGDMTPVTHAARTFSWVEAVSGQFYIAVLVAGIVSTLVAPANRMPPSAPRDTESDGQANSFRDH